MLHFGVAPLKSGDESTVLRTLASRNLPMTWTTPEVREVCAGMEVTAYLSAEM